MNKTQQERRGEFKKIPMSDNAAIKIMLGSQHARAQSSKRRAAYLEAKSKGAGRSNAGIYTPQRGFVGAAGEAKYVDIANATYALDTTGSITHVSVVPQGASVNQRIGRKCELKYFQMRGEMRNNATAVHNNVAVYLVWDEQPNKAMPAITDILDAASVYALSKRENVQRFKIIKKWRAAMMGLGATPVTGTEMVTLDEYVRLPKGLVVVPTTADITGAIADVINGALFLVTVGDTTGAAAAVLQVTCRTGFADV